MLADKDRAIRHTVAVFLTKWNAPAAYDVLAQQSQGVHLPEHKKYSFKLLIDNRAFDARFVKW